MTQVVDERRKAEKRVDEVEGELSRFIASDMIRELAGPETFVKHLHRTDDTATALGFLSGISLAFTNAILASPELAQKLYLVVLSSSPSSQTASSTSVVLVNGSDDKKVKEVGDALKSKLNVKGGGKGPKWTGKFTGVWKEGREDVAVQEVLKGMF